MNSSFPLDLTTLLFVFFALVGCAMLITLALIVWIVLRIRRLYLPPNADFFSALRATPLIVVIVLDLLDFSLDIFSAPISWVLLSYLGLAPLRLVAVVKDLIPITNFVPLMTLAWLYARYSYRRAIASGRTFPKSENDADPADVGTGQRS
jgi:hypothetical protein